MIMWGVPHCRKPPDAYIYVYIYIYVYTHTHTHIYIYIYARDHNFSETSWFGFDGKGENCALAVVICTFLHIDHLVNNIICYGRFFFVRLSWSTRSVCQQWLWHVIVHFTWDFWCFVLWPTCFYVKKCQSSLGNASQNDTGVFRIGICSIL